MSFGVLLCPHGSASLCPAVPAVPRRTPSATPAWSSADLSGGVWVVARLGNDLRSEGPPTSTTQTVEDHSWIAEQLSR